MEITQKVIDIARAKLPNPLGLTFGTIQEVEVSSIETGHSNKDDDCVGIEVVKFILKLSGWEHYFEPALNVVELNPHTKEPGDNVVQRLEQALELARKGELANIAMVAVCNDGDVMDCWANQSNALTMVGGLESLKFEFMNGVIEKRD